MRIAVLSDVHANLTALEAVCGALPEVDGVWVLGDIVGYGPQPNEVIATLQAMGARSVLGNHDGAAIGTVDAAYFNPDARLAIEWTAATINENSRSYLATLPEVRRDGELTAVHGSPRDPIWEYITNSSIAEVNFDFFETRCCLFGHTHLPIVYRRVDGAVEALPGLDGEVITLGAGRSLVNPGSVGQPRDGLPDASYAILELGDDPDGATVAFHRVQYEVDRTQRLMRDAGLPARLVERLRYGR
ncbi:MAG: metallophosphatase family protein [Chloroflexota bacterium]|nr:metallophosphatase family protein [Chloroflexota bacterium]